MAYHKIKSVEEMKKLADTKNNEMGLECFICLAGAFRSSKRIQYMADENLFYVNNEIDDSWQEELTLDQLKTETMIIEAVEKGALYQY